MEQLLLTAKEVAEALHISERQVWRLLESGQMASVHIGRRHLVQKSELEAYVARLASRQS